MIYHPRTRKNSGETSEKNNSSLNVNGFSLFIFYHEEEMNKLAIFPHFPDSLISISTMGTFNLRINTKNTFPYLHFSHTSKFSSTPDHISISTILEFHSQIKASASQDIFNCIDNFNKLNIMIGFNLTNINILQNWNSFQHERKRQHLLILASFNLLISRMYLFIFPKVICIQLGLFLLDISLIPMV